MTGVTRSFLDFFVVCGFSQKSQKKPHTTLVLKSERVTPVTPVPFGAVQYLLSRHPDLPVYEGVCTGGVRAKENPWGESGVMRAMGFALGILLSNSQDAATER